MLWFIAAILWHDFNYDFFRFYGNSAEYSSVYSFGIVCLNFAAFLYMFTAYFIIYKSTSIEIQHGEQRCVAAVNCYGCYA